MDDRLIPYDYNLPPERIAVYPLENRSASKLLVLSDKNWIDSHVFDLEQHLNEGDILVVNNTKVLQARVKGYRETGGKLELFFLSENADQEGNYSVLLRPSRKVKEGETVFIKDGKSSIPVLLERYQGDGEWSISLESLVPDLLLRVGSVPIPPYLQRETEQSDQTRYQTVFAGPKGAVAAPTAGLHLTPELLQKLRNKGVQIAEITLHVGIGTFRNLRSEDLDRGKLHREYYQISQETVELIQSCKKNNGRVIAVGTTVTRCLESVFQSEDDIKEKTGYTDIFIREGYSFQVVDGLLTNFHLPKSSLLMLVCAFGGREQLLQAYQHAISKEYRFFSYGDAMLLLPSA
jgi:S-adenosylmethionine:tRNA ribosyltransferase-isomerase